MLLWRRAPEYLTRHTVALFGALVFFASMFVWRDSIELRIADTAAIVTILSVMFLPRMKVATHMAGMFHYVVAFLWSSINALFAPVAILATDVEWSGMQSGWRKHAFSAVRGVAIAAPLILIFGLLFVAADAAYEGLVQNVFNVMPEVVFRHVLLFSIFAWLSAGYLRGVLIKPLGRSDEKAETRPVGSVPDAPGNASETSSDSDFSPMQNVRAESGEHPVTLPDNMTVVELLNISDPPNANAEG
jgi:hypothetical protein